MYYGGDIVSKCPKVSSIYPFTHPPTHTHKRTYKGIHDLESNAEIRQFAMLDPCENWLSLVNSYVCYARHTYEISKILPYSVDFQARRGAWKSLVDGNT